MPEVLIHHTDVVLATGSVLRVMPITPHVFRVRLRPDGEFLEPGLVRYGIVKSDWPPVPVTTADEGETIRFDTGPASLTISRADGRVTLRDGSGKTLLAQADAPRSDPRTGFEAAFALSEGERLYGLGDETRDRLQKRGHETPMVQRNVVSYAPIPFLMSTGGWALFLNTTWFHHVDAGATQADRLVFRSHRGELDYYLIAGQSLPELLDRYTEISGRPALLPLWAYGLTFVCDERGVRARDVLYEAHTFRREGLPCDGIGLEPDWMDRYYDFSVSKQWSKERFHAPEWLPHHQPGGFTAALGNMGFKLSLWLCCDYDVSECEELQLREAPGRGGEDPGFSSAAAVLPAERYEEDIIRDPHFLPVYQDQITKPGEPWFEHLKKFVDDGAAAFKMDGSNQVCFHPDRKWRNGMDDEEMHNLYPVLLGKQMSQGFRDHTGRRPMIYTACGYAGIQQYAATWAGDTGGNEKPLLSLLNHGLSGHSNTSCDMQVWSPQGIHFGFLQPWSQILSWHQYNQPWFLPEPVYRVFRFYARLRYRLLPYLYSAAHVASRTGLPMMRAMPLVAPEDPRSDELLLQYMLGESLLTCAFTDTIHLPAGRWIDYWTGQVYEGPQEVRTQPPEDRGGPLFVRAGAIIPTWPDVDFVGQAPIETMGLTVYAHDRSESVLYEDDGLTCGYLAGQVATTRIACEPGAGELALTIGPRVGEYEGLVERRTWEVAIHWPATAVAVHVNGEPLPQADDGSGWRHDALGVLHVTVSEDPARRQPVEIRCVSR
jgi:alpha-glucosidase (family GH31 glycosyl hydrolase)